MKETIPSPRPPPTGSTVPRTLPSGENFLGFLVPPVDLARSYSDDPLSLSHSLRQESAYCRLCPFSQTRFLFLDFATHNQVRPISLSRPFSCVRRAFPERFPPPGNFLQTRGRARAARYRARRTYVRTDSLDATARCGRRNEDGKLRTSAGVCVSCQ